MPHETTENYERIRINNPDMFEPESFRTHDIGRKGFSKRIAGRLKSTGKWATQSLLISLNETEQTKRKLRDDAFQMKKRSKRLTQTPFNRSSRGKTNRNRNYKHNTNTTW